MIDVSQPPASDTKDGLKSYYVTKIEELQLVVTEKTQNLRRLQAQRNELNAKGKSLSPVNQSIQAYSQFILIHECPQ